MSKSLAGKVAIALALAWSAAPAASQTSNTYNFIKAVKDRDGAKATQLVSTPGNALINAKEAGTGNTGLHIVTLDRDVSWVSFLSSRGARVDAQNGEGNTPLALAAQIGWVEGAELLLARRASVDLANSRGETPLILAVQRKHAPMVRLLLSKGANPNRTDSIAGYSAIDYAKQDRRGAAILKLLETPRAKLNETVGPKL